MIVVGIDSGTRYTAAIVYDGDRICGKARILTDFNTRKAAKGVMQLALSDAELREADCDMVVATGSNRDGIDFADQSVTELAAASQGARDTYPTAGMVIDLGAEGIRVMRVDQKGKVVDYGVNDKCASGAGSFLENMARVLQVKVDELSDLALGHTTEITMDTQCVVFAESEVISLIHRQVSPSDIAYAVQEGLVNKVSAIVHRVGLSENVVMVGASSMNKSLVASLEKRLDTPIHVPEHPEYIVALGAALSAKNNTSHADRGAQNDR